MGQGQSNDVPLDVPGREHCRRRFTTRMGQDPPIDQAQEANAPEAQQILP